MTLTKIEATNRELLQPIKGPPVKIKPFNTPGPVKLARVYFNLVGRLFPRTAAKQALQLFSKPRSRFSTKSYDELLDRSEEFEVNSNGKRINGRIWDNRGPTVLLVHGWETSGLHLGAFVEPLWIEGFRVVIFDGPAHGTSQGKYANLIDFANAIKCIHLSKGPIEHIISHSFGAFASVFMASQFKNDIQLKSLVLISAPNKLSRVLNDFALMLNLPKVVVLQMHKLIREFFNFDPKTIESASLGQTMNTNQVLVVHDRKDQIVPFHNSLEITHDLPNAQLLETENLGHNRLLKNFQVISRIIRFIKMQK